MSREWPLKRWGGHPNLSRDDVGLIDCNSIGNIWVVGKDSLELDDKWSSAERDDPVFMAGEQIGRILWTMPALTLGKMLGRAELKPDIKRGTLVTIKTSAGEISAVTHSRYFYDPKHERMRS